MLFSDIVNFTEIAAASSPLDVVNMLNDLYHRFDLKTNEHSVYKVISLDKILYLFSADPGIPKLFFFLWVCNYRPLNGTVRYVLIPSSPDCPSHIHHYLFY